MEGRFIGGIGGIIRAGEAIVGGWKGNVIVRVVSGIRRVKIVIRRVNIVSGIRRVRRVNIISVGIVSSGRGIVVVVVVIVIAVVGKVVGKVVAVGGGGHDF